MGNHLTRNQPKQILSKRNSLPASTFSPPSLLSPSPPSSRLSCHHLPYQNVVDGEEEPINEKFVARLKDIDGEVKNSRDKGLDTVGVDKANVGFIGFPGSGRTTLIRSILGCPLSVNDKGVPIIDKRTTFKKSRSVHFSETVSTQLVPFYFRHLTSIVLWEISYPFDVLVNSGENQEQRMERREEKLKTFFIDQHLSKFCLLFVCVDGDEPREEDIAFTRVARQHGKEVVFLKTKSDSLVSSISSQEEASSLLSREKIMFESKLAAIAGDLSGTKTFFLSSRTIPTLISQSTDERIKSFRQLELLPGRLTQRNEEGRRHTMEGGTVESDRDTVNRVISLEEEQLMTFILDQLDYFPLPTASL